MEPIITYKERCRRCYSCVRTCPVKAIKVDQGVAQIIYDRCIGCGNCLSCPQNAKVVVDRMVRTQELLASGAPVVAVLGCSFPAFFHAITPGQLVSGLKSLGFLEIHEGAYGASMIASSYREALNEATLPVISSHCPAVVDLIERHYPKLLPNLMGIASPMIAMGRFIKGILGEDTKVVYISNCIAAKFEKQSKESANAIDVVLTYQEIDKLFKSRGIIPASLGVAPFDGIDPGEGRLFTLTGGPLKVLGIDPDFLDTETISSEGESHTLDIIRNLSAGRIAPSFVDLRFCDGGCVDGPAQDRELNHFYKRKLIVCHNNSQLSYRTAPHYRFSASLPDLRRSFSDKSRKLAGPGKDDIKRILHSTNKFAQGDELNCRACGYNTCREHAVAVYQGLADIEMCLPHNIQRIEEDRGRLMQKYELVRRELDRQAGDDLIVGEDQGIQDVLKLISQVGPTPTTVLIRGETGTGKELTARAIHRLSQRNDKPLVTVNCTTITDSLLESELFGHKKGSFTGAIADKKGLFEAANDGTIFLDEIGEMDMSMQVKLLRVLQNKEIETVGGMQLKKIDTRFIAATHQNLEALVENKTFREDLYYRLSVIPLVIPPLRERKEDIPLLVESFLKRLNSEKKKRIQGLNQEVMSALCEYQWPGNIRELENLIERLIILKGSGIVTIDDLPHKYVGKAPVEEQERFQLPGGDMNFNSVIEGYEKQLITEALQKSGGNKKEAAQMLNLKRTTFIEKLKKMNLAPENSCALSC